MRGKLNAQSRLGFTSKYLTLDGEPWFPIMGEIHYSRVEQARWREELYKMKAGGIDLVSAYTIWIHHEEVENEWDFTGDRDLHRFLETVKECGLHCVLRIGPWAHGEVRNGGFPDWLVEKEKQGDLTTRTDDPAYLEYVRKFYEKIAEAAEGMYLEEGGPIAMIQIENEYGHVGGRTGEEGEQHMRTLQALAREAGLKVQIYTATGWGGAVTGGMLPVMGGYCEAPWDQRLTEIEPSGNYLFTKERNDHNIGSDHGLGVGITFDMERFPYLTAELGGGLQVTKHRRPVATGRDTEAMTLVKLGSGCNLLGYYMYHGGTNPEGKLTTLQESRATGYPNDLPVKSYDFNAPIREYGQLSDSYRRIRRLSLFLHDFGGRTARMDYIPQPGNPEKVDDFRNLRSAVRRNPETGEGLFFVNNYVRHYEMETHRAVPLKAFGEDGKTVLADYGTEDIADGEYYFYPSHMPIGDRAVLETAKAVPLCVLRNGEGCIDTYVFYTKENKKPEYHMSGDPEGIQIITLTEEESLQAQKLIMDGREILAVSAVDFYQTAEGEIRGLMRMKEKSQPVVYLYPCCDSEPGLSREEAEGEDHRKSEDLSKLFACRRAAKEVTNPVSCSISGERSRTDGEELTVQIHVKGIRGELDEAILCVDYEGESAELYQDGRLIADSFYTGQIWEIGLKRFAQQQEAEFTAVIHPLKEKAAMYLEKWPQMENGCACRINGVHAEAIADILI